MRGNIIKKRLISFAFEKTPHISLSCKLVLVQYRECEYGLLLKMPPKYRKLKLKIKAPKKIARAMTYAYRNVGCAYNGICTMMV